MIVLTESMQSEIPKGSLVIAKTVDPDMSADWGRHHLYGEPDHFCHPPDRGHHRKTTRTRGSGRSTTQGIMNAQPDKQMVPAVNAVGKVVFHSEALGTRQPASSGIVLAAPPAYAGGGRLR
ncbi:MAG: hypothetical protein ACLR23_28375 [Clostridia bacterium]